MVVFRIIDTHFLAKACYLYKKASVRELCNGSQNLVKVLMTKRPKVIKFDS